MRSSGVVTVKSPFAGGKNTLVGRAAGPWCHFTV